MIFRNFLVILAGVLSLVSCTPDGLINESRPINNGKWGLEQTELFSAEVSDTIQPFNYYVQVRHGGDYAYQNLIIYFKTYYPNNTYIVDTVNCPLAEPNGKWLGSGLGDIIDSKVLFKLNQRFPQMGNYHFEIQHAMRLDTVQEIYDIGLLIEKSTH